MISPHAIVESNELEKGTSVGEFAIVRAGVSIGENVVIHPYVLINSGATIGSGVEIFPGTIIGKEPKGAGALARTPTFERRIVVGDGCSIGPNAILYYDVEVGDQTLIGDG